MRVTLLTTNLARGGAENETARLALGLQRRGWQMSVISLVQPSAWEDELAQAGVPVFGPGMLRGVAALRRLRPQILHCHLFHANVAGRLVRLIAPVTAVISTIHSVAETGRKSADIRWRDRVYRITDPLADVTVAVSNAAAKRHLQAKAARVIRVIPTSVDTCIFRPDTAARARVRAELGLRDEFVWLAAGRLMWKKDYPTLLAAFAQLDRGTLLIAGTGPDESGLRAIAGANVRFLGARDDVPALMNAADGFVLSSLVEGMPLVLLEAAATGLPCVTTDAGGVRETGAAVSVVPPRDPAALAAAMIHVMNVPADERRRLGDVIRTQVRARFDTEVILSEWESLYRELWT